jgi:hypothetical protein
MPEQVNADQCRQFLQGLAPKDDSWEIWIKQGHDNVYQATWDEQGNLSGTLTALKNQEDPSSRIAKGKPITDLIKHLANLCQKQDGGAFFIPTQPQGLPTAEKVLTTDDIGVELDHLPVADQVALFTEFSQITGLEFASILTSGGSSIHAHLKLDHHTEIAAAQHLRRLAIIAFSGDPVTARLHQPMRLPGFFRREKGQYQELLSASERRYTWEELMLGFEDWFTHRGWSAPDDLITDQWWSEVWSPLLKSSNPASPEAKLRLTAKYLEEGQANYLERRKAESAAKVAKERGEISGTLAEAINHANSGAGANDFEGVDWGSSQGGHHRGQCPFHQGKSGSSAWLSNAGGSLKFHCCICTDDGPRDLFEYFTARRGLTSISNQGELTGRPWVDAAQSFLTHLGYAIPVKPIDKTIHKGSSMEKVSTAMGEIFGQVNAVLADKTNTSGDFQHSCVDGNTSQKQKPAKVSASECWSVATQKEIDNFKSIQSTPVFNPFDVLPKIWAQRITDAAALLNIDPVGIWQYLMPAVSSLMGSETEVEVQDGFKVPNIIWAVLVQHSGGGKSRAKNIVMRTLDQWQQEANEEFKEQYSSWKANNTGKKGEHSTPPEEPPTLRKYVFNVATPQALVRRLAEQDKNGCVLVRDELKGLFKSLDQFTGEGEGLDILLESWDGKGCAVDRVDVENSYYIPASRLSIAGGLQPGVFQKVFSDPDDSQGTLARFLLAVPQQLPVKLVSGKCDLAQHLPMLFTRIKSTDWGTVKLSPEAYAAFDEMYTKLGNEKCPNESTRAWMAKLGAQILRIALPLHAIELCDDLTRDAQVLQKDTLMRAYKLALYYRACFYSLQGFVSSDVSGALLKVYNKAAASLEPLAMADIYRNINTIRTLAKAEGVSIKDLTLDLCRQLQDLGKGRLTQKDGKYFFSAEQEISNNLLEANTPTPEAPNPYSKSNTASVASNTPQHRVVNQHSPLKVGDQVRCKTKALGQLKTSPLTVEEVYEDGRVKVRHPDWAGTIKHEVMAEDLELLS